MYITPEFYVKMKKKEEYKEGKLISTKQKIKIEYKDNLIYNGKSTIDFPLYYYKKIITKIKASIKNEYKLRDIIGFPMEYEGDTIPVICVIIDYPEGSLIGMTKYYTLSHITDNSWNWESYELFQKELPKNKNPRGNTNVLHLYNDPFELKELPMEGTIFYKVKETIKI